MLGVGEVNEVDNESTCRQINLFKSDSDKIDITSESVFLRTEICSFLTQTLSYQQYERKQRKNSGVTIWSAIALILFSTIQLPNTNYIDWKSSGSN